MDGIAASVLDAIGGTPLVALDRLHPGPGRVLGKLELLNPGGSIKDRPARAIVGLARANGELAPGGAVIAATSGNLGAGLAVVCAVLGHPLTLVVSAGTPPERLEALRGGGARIVVVPQVDGRPGRVTGKDARAAARRARHLADEGGGWLLDQLRHPGSVAAHREGTGPELWRQSGELDAFVAAVGSGGTFVGVMQFLGPRGVRGYAVEPAKAAILSRARVDDPRHRLHGCGFGFVPPSWEPSLCHGVETVTDDEIAASRREIRAREGLTVGFSAAANVAVARRIAVRLAAEGLAEPVVATVLCDRGPPLEG